MTVGTLVQGAAPGLRYLRVERAQARPFRRTGQRRWQATRAADQPRTAMDRLQGRLERWLLGSPIPSWDELGQRLSKTKALAVFASDALSSTAYATEEILLVLVLAGGGHLGVSLPIALAISALLLMVVMSYRQTIRAYPQGGGAYSVARENLGRVPGLIAAASLLTDYVLTVAVSISAGMLAVVSALPELAPARVEIAVAAVAIMMLINLRGVRESGTVVAIPAYGFIGAFGALILVGGVRVALGDAAGSLTETAPPRLAVPAMESFGLLLLLRAFASGATALTGVEAIANGVQTFEPPEDRNAMRTMTIMGAILAVFFVGATFLATREGVVPVEDNSVISQLGQTVFGGSSPLYYFLQATTALILILAANTAFNGFPRLSAILARDGFMPRQFAFRGDRLVFASGIVMLGVLAAGLVVAFDAETHRLIPLYAVGVFMAFTLSQAGMVRRLRTVGGPRWRRSAAVSGAGAVLTAVVAVVVGVTKFTGGAWMVLILIPAFVLLLDAIHRHYQRVADRLRLPDQAPPLPPLPTPPVSDLPILVLVPGLNSLVLSTVDYARRLSRRVSAVHIASDEPDALSRLEADWSRLTPDVPLVIIDSPYRSFLGPVLAYIDALDLDPGLTLTVVLPEYLVEHRWQRWLHNRTGVDLERVLGLRPGTVVIRITQSVLPRPVAAGR